MHVHCDRPARKNSLVFIIVSNLHVPTSIILSNIVNSLPIKYYQNKINPEKINLCLKNLPEDWKVDNYVTSNMSHEELLSQNIKELLDAH